MGKEHEEATVRAFAVRSKRERLVTFLATPKNRRKLLQELPHGRWYDERFASPIPWKVDTSLGLWTGHVQGIENICPLLKSKGAGKTCWVLSEDADLDGQELKLEFALLEKVIDRELATILSCIPGRLAFFAGEDETLLLSR